MSEDLFCKNFFTVQYKLENKINVITLVNIYVTGYNFIDENFAEIDYQIFKIEPQRLTKSKPIQEFDGKVAQLVTHIIYLILLIGSYSKSLASLLMTK